MAKKPIFKMAASAILNFKKLHKIGEEGASRESGKCLPSKFLKILRVYFLRASTEETGESNIHA